MQIVFPFSARNNSSSILGSLLLSFQVYYINQIDSILYKAVFYSNLDIFHATYILFPAFFFSFWPLLS